MPQKAQGEWQKQISATETAKVGGLLDQRAAGAKASEPGSLAFGLVQMDNGEIAILCSSEETKFPERPRRFAPAVASARTVAPWSPFMIIPAQKGGLTS